MEVIPARTMRWLVLEQGALPPPLAEHTSGFGAVGFPTFFRFYAGVVVLQGLHMVEHVAQAIQRYGLGWPAAHAHGLIGFLDLELVHLIYNGLLLFALYGLWLVGRRHLSQLPLIPYTLFLTVLVVQSYHIVEHIVKFVQHLQRGIQGTPGILGPFFVSTLWFHFWMNLVVMLLTAIPFIALWRSAHRRRLREQ